LDHLELLEEREQLGIIGAEGRDHAFLIEDQRPVCLFVQPRRA